MMLPTVYAKEWSARTVLEAPWIGETVTVFRLIVLDITANGHLLTMV
jgi:hypothetical protein